MLLLWMTHQCLKTLLHNIVQKQLSFSAVSSIPLYLFLNKIIMYFCTLTCIGQINLMCNNIRLWPVFICEIEPHVSREVLTRKQMIVIYLTPWQASFFYGDESAAVGKVNITSRPYLQTETCNSSWNWLSIASLSQRSH